MIVIEIAFRACRKVIYSCYSIFNKVYCRIIFYCYNINYGSFKTTGIPYISIARGGKMKVGDSFFMHNSVRGNPIGCYGKCTFVVDSGAELIIGNNVGISQTALISHCRLSIGNNVKIGGGTCIYTSDFHSLIPEIRNSSEDLKNRNYAPVSISNNVFIGARCIILKGVTIGENSVIGAGSVVTCSVPANQVWAGNPARFIKNI